MVAGRLFRPVTGCTANVSRIEGRCCAACGAIYAGAGLATTGPAARTFAVRALLPGCATGVRQFALERGGIRASGAPMVPDVHRPPNPIDQRTNLLHDHVSFRPGIGITGNPETRLGCSTLQVMRLRFRGIKRLSYDMLTRGGNIRLKYLKPKESPAGVMAKPFGKSTLYPKSFMMGGAFPDRKAVAKFGGHVMFRNRSGGRHYTFARSGVFIPREMTTGATKTAFETTATPLLQERVEKVLRKLFP